MYNQSRKDHLKHLEVVLKLLEENRLFAKRSKYVFRATQVKYLGYIIHGQRVPIDPKKVFVIKE